MPVTFHCYLPILQVLAMPEMDPSSFGPWLTQLDLIQIKFTSFVVAVSDHHVGSLEPSNHTQSPLPEHE